MTRFPGVLIESCPWWSSLISVPRGMIIVGKFAWSAAALISPSPLPDKRRRQRLEVAVVLGGPRLDQERRLGRPLVVEDVDARIDRHVGSSLLEIAAHFVVQMGVRGPAGRT